MKSRPLVLLGALFCGGACTSFAASACPLSRNSDAIQLTKPADGALRAGFGYRRHPILGHAKLHPGWDLELALGAPIKAAATGRVISAGYDGPHGNRIIIDHGDGIETAYAHLSEIAVAKGACVAGGAVVGAAGSTGLSTGPHLHFEVRQDGSPMDPGDWLDKRTP